jgi:phage-related protein
MANVLRIYMTADGTPMVRTFEEVAAASDDTTHVIEKNSVKQAAAFDDVKEGAGRLHESVGLLAGTLGLGGLAFGVKDVIEAGEQWQQQQAQLQNALKNTGEYSQRTMNMVRDSAESLSTRGGFAGPEEIAAMNQFIRLTGSATKAVQLNKEATNLARGTSISYGQAQSLIERTMAGSTRGLQRYLGIIQPVKTAEFALTQSHGFNLAAMQAQSLALGKLGPLWLKHQEILHNLTPVEVQHAQLLDKQATATRALQAIQEKYGNSTASFSKTTAGSLSNIRNQFDILGETIGRKFLPIVSSVLGFMSRNLTAILIATGALTALGIAYEVGKTAIAIWTAAMAACNVVTDISIAASQAYEVALINLTAGAEEASLAMKAWAAVQVIFNAIMDANPIGLVVVAIAALVAAVIVVATHFKWFEGIVASVWKWLETATGNVVKFVEKAFSKVFHILSWPFVQAWKLISTIFDHIKDGIKHLLGPIGTLIHGVSSVGSSIGGFISHPFGLHNGGIIPHMATGGLIGGYGGGDRWPAMLESGEGVLRKEAVQSLGSQTFNAINATGSVPPSAMGGGGENTVYVMGTIVNQMGQRVVSEQTVYQAAKKSALSGRYVSG